MELTLVSHPLCPYVQRVAIVLLEKGVPFTRRWVDLGAKPPWFTAISPLGRTPVLLAGEQAIFESAVICEYLEDTLQPRLHPADALERARHRAWIEFGSNLLDTIAAYYSAPDGAAIERHRAALRGRFAQLEPVLRGGGSYFAGSRFSIVDAVFAPVFRYFDAFERLGQGGWFSDMPRVQAWRQALRARASVQQAVVPDYEQRLVDFLQGRGSELSRRIASDATRLEWPASSAAAAA